METRCIAPSLASLRQDSRTCFRAAAAPRRAVSYRRVEAQCSLQQRVSQAAAAVVLTGALLAGGPAEARLEGVNKPELLPSEFTTVIDVSGQLTAGEEARLKQRIEALERDTGVKLRVLAQNYPDTPGLAIRDYWGVDQDTVVFVADPNFANLINLNVGEGVDLKVPRNFWTRLASKFGTTKYVTDQGQDTAIVNTVAAIDNCLREPIGRGQCSDIRGILE